MKMTKAVCCHECFERIGLRNVYAAKLWLELCDLKLKNGMFGLRVLDFPELRMLEVLRFITTTESPQHIIVRVNGEKKDQEGIYFCCGACNDNA